MNLRCSEIARVFFDGAQQLADLSLEALNTGADLTVGGVVSSAAYGCEVLFGLCDDTRHAVCLELIHSVHAFVYKWISAEGGEVERKPEYPKEHGFKDTKANIAREGEACTSENRAKDFAW